MTVQFRRARLGDARTLLEMMRGLFAHFEMAHPPEAEAALHGALSREDLAHLWLMEAPGNAVGYFVLAFGFSLEFGGRYGFLDELYVAPEYRDQGVGSQALAFAEQEARRLGLGAVFLEADREDPDVQRFYRRHGYASRRYDLLFKRLEAT